MVIVPFVAIFASIIAKGHHRQGKVVKIPQIIKPSLCGRFNGSRSSNHMIISAFYFLQSETTNISVPLQKSNEVII